MNSKTCIIVSGPTAVGKTDYGIELAQKYHTKIISADSRQCYKELNIGVAKPSPDQLNRIHHYFINTHSINDEVNVKVFENYALDAVQKIFVTNDVAIMVGGTGLYIKAFCEGIDDIPLINENIKTEEFIVFCGIKKMELNGFKRKLKKVRWATLLPEKCKIRKE